MICISARLVSEGHNYHYFPRCLYRCYFVLLGQSVNKFPKTKAVRWIFGLWCFAGYIISLAFQANLMTALNFDSYEKQISHMEDIINSGLKFGYFDSTSSDTFADSKDPDEQYIHKHALECDIGIITLV